VNFKHCLNKVNFKHQKCLVLLFVRVRAM
jgi:hypothetical protein